MKKNFLSFITSRSQLLPMAMLSLVLIAVETHNAVAFPITCNFEAFVTGACPGPSKTFHQERGIPGSYIFAYPTPSSISSSSQQDWSNGGLKSLTFNIKGYMEGLTPAVNDDMVRSGLMDLSGSGDEYTVRHRLPSGGNIGDLYPYTINPEDYSASTPLGFSNILIPPTPPNKSNLEGKNLALLFEAGKGPLASGVIASLTAIAEPTTMLLFCSALIGLLGFSRKFEK